MKQKHLTLVAKSVKGIKSITIQSFTTFYSEQMKHSKALIQAQLMIQDTPVQLFELCASSVLPFDETT